MKKINLFKQFTSENFQRANKIQKGIRIISSITKGGKIANPINLYIETALSLANNIHQYITLKKEKEITIILEGEDAIFKEKIDQFHEFISAQRNEIYLLNKTVKKEIAIIDDKFINQDKKIEFNHHIFSETTKILLLIKEILEKEKKENSQSKNFLAIEKEYIKAISAKNIALINIISKDNNYEINF